MLNVIKSITPLNVEKFDSYFHQMLTLAYIIIPN